MSKMRLHELAKELGIKTTALIEKARELDMGKLSNFSSLDAKQIKKLKGQDTIENQKPKKTSAKPKKRVVFINQDNDSTRSYSSDQRYNYVPKPKGRRPLKPAAPKHGPKNEETEVEKAKSSVVTVSQQPRTPAPGRAGQITNEKTKARGSGAKQHTPNEKSKKSIIGTISNVNDYSRPMPMGRPSISSTKNKSDYSRPARRDSSDSRDGRPNKGRFSDNKPAQFKDKKSFTDRSSTTVVEELTKSGSKRTGKKQKKTSQSFDKDRVDKKLRGAKGKKHRNSVYDKGDFDFGKKQKQKAGKYKEKTEKERSIKLDEYLQKEIIYISEDVTVAEFATLINKNVNEIIMKLMAAGHMMTLNHVIDYDTAALIAMDYNINLELEVVEEVDHIEDFNLDYEDDPDRLEKKAPVVTVMGHVDHGKTSLLDAIRNTGIAPSEAGGITQHIGASEVVYNNERILFLDTPGHEAFTSLRARGAKVTDISILVVAADDGVMPQTIEAIDHSKAAGVPVIVAINKIDKPAANPDRVKQELSERGLVVEQWGGDVIAVPVSAKTGEGLDKLLEMVLLVAEMQDLKANPDRPAVGTVIEAKVVMGRGTVASIIVQKGTLELGDNFVAGKTYGKIRAMYNHKGEKISKVGPSTSVEIDGLSDMPLAGERFFKTPDEKVAKDIADKYAIDYRNKTLNKSSGVRLEQLFSKIQEGTIKDLNIIIRADVHGSVEAIKSSLLKLSNDEVKVSVIRADVGAISESDVILASASDALIIGFNVRPSVNVISMAEEEAVDIRTYSIIYQAIDDIQDAMKGMLAPVFKELVLGRATVRETFKIPGGMVAGCYVTSGKLQRNAQVRVIRDGIVLFTGKVSSLKRFKDDAREVLQGYECGLGIEKFTDIVIDDELEAFVMEEVER